MQPQILFPEFNFFFFLLHNFSFFSSEFSLNNLFVGKAFCLFCDFLSTVASGLEFWQTSSSSTFSPSSCPFFTSPLLRKEQTLSSSSSQTACRPSRSRRTHLHKNGLVSGLVDNAFMLTVYTFTFFWELYTIQFLYCQCEGGKLAKQYLSNMDVSVYLIYPNTVFFQLSQTALCIAYSIAYSL